MESSKPLVGVISDRRIIDPHWFQMAGDKYLSAVVEGAGCLPVILPALGDTLNPAELLSRLDGVLLTGNASNVQPERYGQPPAPEGTLQDPGRDQAAMEIIPATLALGLPLLAICRGHQEVNVALGGTLHQRVYELPGMLMHKENDEDPLAVQYGPSHEVQFTSGGLLEAISGQRSATVNSVHGQGIDRLADGLTIEAVSADGLVEAFVVEDTVGFNLSVQWHPEWQVRENDLYLAIFKAFGDACRDWMKR